MLVSLSSTSTLRTPDTPQTAAGLSDSSRTSMDAVPSRRADIPCTPVTPAYWPPRSESFPCLRLSVQKHTCGHSRNQHGHRLRVLRRVQSLLEYFGNDVVPWSNALRG